MPIANRHIDLVNGPKELAARLYREQLDAARGQVAPRQSNPIVDVLHQHGLTLKGLRNNGNT